MALDPRTPVIVGGGQWSNRTDRGEPPVEPADLAAEALRRAGRSAGMSAAALAEADAVWIVQLFSWRYANPAAVVAERLGAAPRDLALTPIGGEQPQVLVSQACVDIAAGHRDLVLIAGAEAWRSRRDPGGAALGWTPTASRHDPPPRSTGDEAPLIHAAESARGLMAPPQIYPLFEQALRHSLGRTVDEHLDAVSRLWARFGEVAAANPHAWIQTAMTAEAIRTPSPANRWVVWPYTKVMNANNAVEQGAGVIVTSVERAERLGIPPERWVFPWAAVEAHDHYAVSHRADLASSPAIRLAGRRLFELVDRGPDDLAHVDLYSCFPSAVQVAARELGLGTDRDLTVTGGLAFAGGPWNDYVSHSLATMVDVLRADAGSLGLVTGNGGYLTKHALAVYSTEPPPRPFAATSVQDEVDALPRRQVVEVGSDANGDGGGAAGALSGRVESWVVGYDRSGDRDTAYAAVLLDDDRRAWATSTDPDTLVELTSGTEYVGRSVKVTPTGDLLL
jgi:acetyl-CoA C-acetyltransferase